MHEVEFPPELIERIKRRRPNLHMFAALQPAKTALLVVDMQNAFVAAGAALEIPLAREIVPTINRLSGAVRRAGGAVVWAISTYGPRAEDRWPILFDHAMSPQAGARFRGALTEGRESHRIYPALAREPADPVVSKNRLGAFIGSDGRLETLLRARGLETLLIVGTVTNMCCEATAREASALSFKTIMVSDANAGRTDHEQLATLSSVVQALGAVRTSAALIAMLEAGSGRPA